MRAVLIGNPVAGRKAGLTTNPLTIVDAVAALQAAGIEPAVWLTEGAGDAERLARRAVADGAEAVITAGGDGTVQEVAQALVGTDMPLGIMPLGSVMNIARALGIPHDLAAAARLIRDARCLRMDVGQVDGRYFLECAGVGIEAALFSLLHEIDSGRWGSLRTLFRTALRYQPTKLTLGIDGRAERACALMVSVANIPYFGWSFELHPEAKVDDRQFEVKVFNRFSRWELFQFGLQIARGTRPYHPKLQTLRGRTIAVSSSRPLPVHADTHLIGTTPVTFRLVPHGLRVFANPAHAGAELTAIGTPRRQRSEAAVSSTR
jgi:diacylglycerol kinase (ATP)